VSISVTESELLDALASAQRVQPDGQTVTEMADATGVDRRKVLNALRVIHKEGRLQVRQAHRLGINGRAQPVPVYTILPKKKK
jgi:hypothetical protein